MIRYMASLFMVTGVAQAHDAKSAKNAVHVAATQSNGKKTDRFPGVLTWKELSALPPELRKRYIHNVKLALIDIEAKQKRDAPPKSRGGSGVSRVTPASSQWSDLLARLEIMSPAFAQGLSARNPRSNLCLPETCEGKTSAGPSQGPRGNQLYCIQGGRVLPWDGTGGARTCGTPGVRVTIGNWRAPNTCFERTVPCDPMFFGLTNAGQVRCVREDGPNGTTAACDALPRDGMRDIFAEPYPSGLRQEDVIAGWNQTAALVVSLCARADANKDITARDCEACRIIARRNEEYLSSLNEASVERALSPRNWFCRGGGFGWGPWGSGFGLHTRDLGMGGGMGWPNPFSQGWWGWGSPSQFRDAPNQPSGTPDAGSRADQ